MQGAQNMSEMSEEAIKHLLELDPHPLIICGVIKHLRREQKQEGGKFVKKMNWVEFNGSRCKWSISLWLGEESHPDEHIFQGWEELLEEMGLKGYVKFFYVP